MPIFNNINKALLNKEFTFNITSANADTGLFDEYRGPFKLYTGIYRKNGFQIKHYHESGRLFVYDTELSKNEPWYKNCMSAMKKMDSIETDEKDRFYYFTRCEDYEAQPHKDIVYILQQGRCVYRIIETDGGRLMVNRLGSPLEMFDGGTMENNLGLILSHQWKSKNR